MNVRKAWKLASNMFIGSSSNTLGLLLMRTKQTLKSKLSKYTTISFSCLWIELNDPINLSLGNLVITHLSGLWKDVNEVDYLCCRNCVKTHYIYLWIEVNEVVNLCYWKNLQHTWITDN